MVARLVARLDGMPLAIELAAARVEALGVAQLLDRIDDRFTLLEAGDRLAAARQRSLAATVEWSYRLLDERERRVFRAVSVFPGPFTLEGAEAVAGAGAGPAVLHLVDCSLLVPPRAGPDGRSRYVMLETLRAYGAGLLAEAGEGDAVAAALAGYALRVAEDAMAGLMAGTSEVAAARRLDAEGATMRQALDWAMEHDAAVAPRLAAALAWWWQIRGRLAGQVPLLREAVDRAAAGSDAWCTRAHLARSGVAGFGRSGRGAAPLHRGPRRHRRPRAVPAAGQVPERPGGDVADHGPDRRGGRRCPPCRGPGPGGRSPARRGAGPGGPRPGRLRRRRPRRRRAAGPAGGADHGRPARPDGPGVRPHPDHGADRGRRPGRRRADLRGRRWPGPGTRATCGVWGTCWRRWWFST